MDLSTCAEEQLYWNFAIAEIRSNRYGSEMSERLGPRVSALVRKGDSSALGSADRDAVRRAVLSHRDPVLRELQYLDFGWFRGDLPIEDVAAIRVMNTPAFIAYAPTRQIAEFVSKLDQRVPLTGDDAFAANYHHFRRRFDPAKVIGRPILLAPNETGPFTELEGLTRLCSYASAWSASEVVLDSVPILLGVSPRVHEWSWY